MCNRLDFFLEKMVLELIFVTNINIVVLAKECAKGVEKFCSKYTIKFNPIVCDML